MGDSSGDNHQNGNNNVPQLRQISDTSAWDAMFDFYGMNAQPSLVELVKKNDVSGVHELLKKEGAAKEVNAIDTDTLTPLHHAIEKNSTVIATILIDHGANVHASDRFGFTPLHYSCQDNCDVATTALLIENGSDLEAKTNDGKRPLHIAAQHGFAFTSHVEKMKVEKLKLLIQSGAEIHVTDNKGNTPLCGAGSLEVVKLLMVQPGAETNVKGEQLSVILHNCTHDFKLMEFLLKHGANPNDKDDGGKTVLNEVCSLDAGFPRVKLLLENGVNTNTKDKDGVTPLHGACEGYFDDEHYCDNDFEVVKLLLRNGADIRARDKNGRTPFHVVCGAKGTFYDGYGEGYFEFIKLLVENGAEINAKDKNGKTVLHMEIENQKGFECYNHDDGLKTIKYLLENGADARAQDIDGKTPMHFVCQNDECWEDDENYRGYTAADFSMVRLLKRYGADVNAKDKNGMTPLHIACKWKHHRCLKMIGFMVKMGANVRAQNYGGKTPLHSVCENGESWWWKEQREDGNADTNYDDFTLIKSLVEKGADVNSGDCNGTTPIHLVCDRAHEKDRRDLVMMLKKFNVDINPQDNDGRTSLHVLCKNGYVSTVELLLDLGAKVDVETIQGETPLDLASEGKHLETIWLLIHKYPTLILGRLE